MATKLEETTTTARRVFVGCGIIVIVILLYNFASKFLKPSESPFNPYPTEAEDRFGNLPELSFNSLLLSEGSEPTYRIYTTDGDLPSIHQFINVYKTKTPRQSLTAQDDALATAKALGFTVKAKVISSTELKWNENNRTLKINKLFGTVRLTTNYRKHKEASKDRNIKPKYNSHVNQAKNFLSKANLFPSEYVENSDTSLTYLRLTKNYQLRQASAVSEANMIRVDFFKKEESLTPIALKSFSDEEKENIRELAEFSTVNQNNPYIGLVYIIFGGSQGKGGIYEVRYTDWELEEKSRYKTISVEKAWEAVQKNEGSLQYLYEPNADPYKPYVPLDIEEYLLTDVEIMYYSSHQYIQYLQPVYKFSGLAPLTDEDTLANFVIYYPAIKR